MSANMVRIENTSKAAVYIPHIPEEVEEGGKKKLGAFANDSTTVPRATKEETTDEAGGKNIRVINGSAEIPADIWERAKKNKLVAAYLSSGTLRVVGSSSGPPTAQANAAAGGGKGGR